MKQVSDETFEQTVDTTDENNLMKRATEALLKDGELMKKAAARIRELDKANKLIAESLKDLLSKIPDSLESPSNPLYEGKYFYEVVKDGDEGAIHLHGPMDTIRYVNNVEGNAYNTYKFVQVVDGRITQAFTEKEILVTDHIL